MRALMTCAFVVTILMVLQSGASGQSEDTRPAGLPSDVNIIAFGMRAEGALLSGLRDSTPLAEGYFQRFIPAEKIGYAIGSDRYLLGRFKAEKEPLMEDLLHFAGTPGDSGQKSAGDPQLLEGLLQIMTPDWNQLGPDRYEYKFVNVVFLGALRCVVYDVRPINPEQDGFTGRLYFEDKTWNIVRFTGMNPRADAKLAPLRDKNSRFRIDSWRMQVTRKRWAPAYAYVEEVAPLDAPKSPLVKGQIRFWGFARQRIPQQKLTNVVLEESPSTTRDRKDLWPSPQQSHRRFENQAEQNVLDRFSEASFLGAPGEVEAILDQVATNLIITNKLVLGQPVHCRILLTTPLEAFTVGNTIVLSRGLVDVLPSESAVALVLAHQLAHNLLGHPRVDTSLAFAEVLRISDAELLAKLRFHHTPDEEKEADAKAMELLEQSPYATSMLEAGLFMEALQVHAMQLSNLIQSHFGEHFADVGHGVSNNEIVRVVPVHDPASVGQVAALPLGSKLIVDPWDGTVKLFRPDPLPAPAVRERAELAVTPFMPFLDYFAERPIAPEPEKVAAQPKAHGKRNAPRTHQARSRSTKPVKNGA